jgi:hypothetical protein
MEVGTYLVILAMTQVNGIARTFGDTNPATLTQGRVDLRYVVFINPGNPVRTAHDTDQTGGTAFRIHHSNGTANT